METTQTAQVQIWTKPTLRELGMKTEDWGMAEGDEPNSVIYANYLYSWTDMSLITDAEDWPEALKPGHLSYWCGTIPDASPIEPFSSHWFSKAQLARVMGITELKLYQQFFLLNIEPSDRYVIALPGTNKYRMKTDDSGYSNLFLTGDWINFGFNVGHMEGAVTAGLTAAHAIRKSHCLNNDKQIF